MSRELHKLGLLTTLDKTVFAIYCQSWSAWVQAVKKLSETGPLIKSPSGYPIQNPYLAVKNKAEDQMMKSLTELGMSPSSRTRIKVQPNKEKDQFEEFLSGQQPKK